MVRASIASLNRPLSKMDIFYSGSRTRLNSQTEQWQSSGQPTNMRKRVDSEGRVYLSTLAIPAVVDSENEANVETGWKSGVKASLKSMIDISLMKSPSFLILAFTGFLTLSCLFVPFIFVRTMAEENGVPKDLASYLVVILGLVNVFGRFVIGLLADHPKVDPIAISNVAVLIGGSATIIAPFLTSFWMFALYCSAFAFGVAGFATLRSVIVVELLGIEKLTNAYGLLLLFMGIAALTGPPFAAFLMNQTNSYVLSFGVMGGMMVLSGVLSLPLRKINKCEMKKSKTNDKSELELLRNA